MAQILHHSLITWHSDLLQTLKLVSSAKPGAAVGNFAALRVAYVYCRILVHRTLLHVTHKHPAFSHHYQEAANFLEAMALELEALTLLDFGSFWFSWSRVQFNTVTDFFVLMCVLASTEDERQYTRAAAARHRQWLWLHSKYFEVTRMSLVRLDTLLSAIDSGKMM